MAAESICIASQLRFHDFPYKSLYISKLSKLSWNISLSITELKSPFNS